MENNKDNYLIICDTNIAIFLSMKTAKIKRGRRKKDYFRLENRDYRINLAHEKISEYRQRGIKTAITKTIMDEFRSSKIREIVDKLCSFFNFAQRTHIINQILKKREGIISKFSRFDIKMDDIRDILKGVTYFYSDPSRKDVLEKLREKKNRKDILPEMNDRIILAECCFIGKEEKKQVTLLTDDGDFTEFAKDIKKVFGVKVESLV